jgi:signal transduction histidine kinase
MIRHRLLAVDDDAAILEVLSMRLDAMGFDVTATRDPTTALDALSRIPFDVALFDLRMEAMDGIALTRAALELQARLPILIMTAHGSIETAVTAIKEGAFDYVTKPFDAAELRRKLNRAIAERRWTRDRALLRRLGETLASSSTMDRTLRAVARATLEATESEYAHVFLVDKGEPTLRASVSIGDSPLPPRSAVTEAARRAVAEAVPMRLAHREDRDVLAAPLLIEGVAHGALVAEARSFVVSTADDLETLSLFAGQAAVAVKNAQSLSRLGDDALAALGRVATAVAHDLNNPLNGLKLQVCLLAERFQTGRDEAGLDLTQRMERTIDHLASLVGDILTFGRPRVLNREPVALEPLVQECLSLIADPCARQRIEVALELADVSEPLSLDPVEIRRALANLLQNAVDAMPEGGVLKVIARRNGSSGLELAVEDNGVGMDEKTAARMSDLFFTTKQRGTGLGMAIVRTAIERHGGHLQISSEPGRGTRVRIELPL